MHFISKLRLTFALFPDNFGHELHINPWRECEMCIAFNAISSKVHSRLIKRECMNFKRIPCNRVTGILITCSWIIQRNSLFLFNWYWIWIEYFTRIFEFDKCGFMPLSLPVAAMHSIAKSIYQYWLQVARYGPIFRFCLVLVCLGATENNKKIK